MKIKILQAADSPHDLESLYRAEPEAFAGALPAALADQPDALLLQAWKERLFFDGSGERTRSAVAAGHKSSDIGFLVALALIAGTLAKLPRMIPLLNDDRFYSRNLAVIVIGALIAYFCVQRPCPRRFLFRLAVLLGGALIFINLLPDHSRSQTLVLACLHFPFFLWSLLGVAFLGGAWKKFGGRMDYLRFNGELLIFTIMILIGGMVLTGLTLALFSLIKLRIDKWYLEYVVVYGAIAAPLVATFLVDKVVRNRLNMAPILARVFTPLFLLTVLAYLLAMVANRKSPYSDREFLMAFNALLLVVLGLCVFSISERGHQKTGGGVDLMNIALGA